MRVIVCLIAIVSVSAFVAASGATAKSSSNCRNIRTYQEAARAGELPAIGAALHGGAPINLTCSS